MKFFSYICCELKRNIFRYCKDNKLWNYEARGAKLRSFNGSLWSKAFCRMPSLRNSRAAALCIPTCNERKFILIMISYDLFCNFKWDFV